MSNRKQKREAQRLEIKIRDKFTMVCEGFTSDYLKESINGLTEERKLELLNIYDKNWRHFVSLIITNNPKFYNDTKKKTRISSAFINFVNNWYDKMNTPIGDNQDKKG